MERLAHWILVRSKELRRLGWSHALWPWSSFRCLSRLKTLSLRACRAQNFYLTDQTYFYQLLVRTIRESSCRHRSHSGLACLDPISQHQIGRMCCLFSWRFLLMREPFRKLGNRFEFIQSRFDRIAVTLFLEYGDVWDHRCQLDIWNF